MNIENNRANSESQIRELLDTLVNSVRSKNLAGVMDAYDPKLVAAIVSTDCTER